MLYAYSIVKQTASIQTDRREQTSATKHTIIQNKLVTPPQKNSLIGLSRLGRCLAADLELVRTRGIRLFN